MNRKKFEKQIQEKINITPDFSKIKSEINFEKYTKVEEKKEKISFKFNYWRLATPLAMVVVLIVLFLQKGPDSSMQKPSGPNLESSVIVSSNTSSSSSIISSNDSMASAPETSKPEVSSSSGILEDDESNMPEEKPQDPQGPDAPGNIEQVYNEMDGYFYFDSSYNEDEETGVINEVCFVRYAFDLDNEYDLNSYVRVRAYIGVHLINNEDISLLFEINGETVYSLDNIDETYTFSFFEDELHKPYISLLKYVEFDIKLANLENSQGTLDLKVKSLNDPYIEINNDVIYYLINNGKVVLY